MIRILFFQLFKELIYGALIFLVLFFHRSVFQQIHQRREILFFRRCFAEQIKHQRTIQRHL